MVQFAKWKIALVLAVIVGGIVAAIPNLLDRAWLEQAPSWVPKNQVNLGLDLQGGSHLLLEVDLEALEREHMNTFLDTIRVELRRAQIGYVNLAATDTAVTVEIRDVGQAQTRAAP